MASSKAATRRPPAAALRRIALAMAAALAVLVALAIALQPQGSSPLPATVAWILGAVGAGNLLVGTLLGATAEPSAAGYPTRALVSLALREAGGLLGAVVTLLGGDPAWALGLGGAAIVALVAVLPRADAA